MRITFHNDIFCANPFFARFQKGFNLDRDLEVEFVSQESPNRLADAIDTPFATVPTAKRAGRNEIVFNKDIIDELGFTQEELLAQIAHEIGHIIQGGSQQGEESKRISSEINCDSIAAEYGLSLALANALNKLSERYSVLGLSERLEALCPCISFYRPEWTCGKFNAEASCAIMYNLIEGMSYYFQDESASVISTLLAHKRWQKITIADFPTVSLSDIPDLLGFLGLLLEVKLLTLFHWDNDDILDYRRNVVEKRHEEGPQSPVQTHSDEAFARSEAEELYLERVKTCGSVMLELTYRCSEQCIHCYNPGASRNNKERAERGEESTELKLEDYVRIIDNLADAGLFKVCLTGGDPFSKSCIWEIIEYLYEKEIAVDIFTNGQGLYGKENRLANLYPRSVGISIYSMLSSVHDGITRVKGSLSKSVEVAKRIASLAIPEYIKCCVMKNNMGSYSTIYAFADEIRAVAQVDINVTNSIDGDKCVSCFLKPSAADFDILLRDPRAILYVDEHNITRNDINSLKNARICKAGINSFCISPRGDLMPCCALHLVFGSIKDSSIEDMLLKSETYKKWKSLKLADYTECTKCDDFDFCPLCPGFNYSEHHNVVIPSRDNCEIARFRHNVYNNLINGHFKNEVTLKDTPNNALLRKTL